MKKGVILYEGSDEKHVLYHLINMIFNMDVFDFIDYPDDDEIKGYSQLLEKLPVHIKGSEKKPIGVIIDANTSLSARWESIRNILIKANYSNIPAAPDSDGTIIVDESPKLPDIGIWIMPDNSSEGMLENFIRQLIPEKDGLISIADQSVQNLIDTEKNLFKIVHKSKAEIHTWLAWQKEPGTPMGQAITKQYLDTNKELAKKFIGWFDNLFGLSVE